MQHPVLAAQAQAGRVSPHIAGCMQCMSHDAACHVSLLSLCSYSEAWKGRVLPDEYAGADAATPSTMQATADTVPCSHPGAEPGTASEQPTTSTDGTPAPQHANGVPQRVPRVFYATRTHSQITQVDRRAMGAAGHSMSLMLSLHYLAVCMQVVRELKRSGYQPRMAILVRTALYMLSCMILVYSTKGIILQTICMRCRHHARTTAAIRRCPRKRTWTRSATGSWRTAPANTSQTCRSCLACRTTQSSRCCRMPSSSAPLCSAIVEQSRRRDNKGRGGAHV